MHPVIQRIARIAATIEDGLLTLLLTGMVVLAFVQIALRNLGDISLSWGDPLLRVAVLWLALVGAIAATRDDNHIRIDLLSRYLPNSFALPLKRLTELFSASICGIIAWHSALLVQMEYQDGTTSFSGIPTWMLELILPLGFGIMALRFLINGLFPPVHQGPEQ
jgi:TRAP-type C4-dicarboxylate transport system permease small subunit